MVPPAACIKWFPDESDISKAVGGPADPLVYNMRQPEWCARAGHRNNETSYIGWSPEVHAATSGD